MSRTTASTRLLGLALATVLPLGVAGCGGGSDDSTTTSSSGASQPAPSSPRPSLADRALKGCSADVRVSGPASAAWKGKAEVRRPRGEGAAVTALYQTRSGSSQLSAVAGAGDNPDVAVVSVDGANYSTAGQAGTMRLAPDGSRAVIDAPAVDSAGASVRLRATFSCAG